MCQALIQIITGIPDAFIGYKVDIGIDGRAISQLVMMAGNQRPIPGSLVIHDLVAISSGETAVELVALSVLAFQACPPAGFLKEIHRYCEICVVFIGIIPSNIPDILAVVTVVTRLGNQEACMPALADGDGEEGEVEDGEVVYIGNHWASHDLISTIHTQLSRAEMEARLQVVTGGEAGIVHIVDVTSYLTDFLTFVKGFLDAAAACFDDAFLAADIKADVASQQDLVAIPQYRETVAVGTFLVQIKLQGIRIYTGILIADSGIAKEEDLLVFMIVINTICGIEKGILPRCSS